jgi:hypothetical protein
VHINDKVSGFIKILFCVLVAAVAVHTAASFAAAKPSKTTALAPALKAINGTNARGQRVSAAIVYQLVGKGQNGRGITAVAGSSQPTVAKTRADAPQWLDYQ